MNVKLRASVLAFAALIAAAGTQYAFFGRYAYVDDLALVNPQAYARSLMDKGAYKDAQDYITFYLSLPGVSEVISEQLVPLAEQCEQKRQSLGYRIGELGRGFFLGDSRENYGQGAEFASALLGVSDVRDLVRAGDQWLHGEDVDELTTSLAAIGLVLTAAAVGVQAPAAISAKAGVAVIKTAAAAGRLTKAFRASLKMTASRIASSSAGAAISAELIRPLGVLASYAGRSGLNSAVEVAARLNSLSDVPHVVRVAESFGPRAAAVLRFGGKDVVVAAEKRGAAEVLAVSRYGEGAVSALKTMPARALLHDIRRWTSILASPLLKLLDLFLWVLETLLGIVSSIAAFLGLRLLRGAAHVRSPDSASSGGTMP